MAETSVDLIALWRVIQAAGGRRGWVDAQLREKGLLVERVDTEKMSDKDLSEYKKQLKAEAAERKKLAREAWTAYKANHIVHVGEGVFWNDAATTPDKWDLPNAEERAAENELPA